jgi:Mg-chelatase subunit ChlD
MGVLLPMRVRRPLLLVGALALALGWLALPGTAHADNPRCSDLTIIFARGAGQNPIDKSEQQSHFFSAVRQHTPDGISIGEIRLGADPVTVKLGNKTKSYQYPARGAISSNLVPTPTWSWFPVQNLYSRSVEEGVLELRAILSQRGSSCPNERWIIGGYSQGAQVVGNAVSQIDQSLRDRVAFLALFGDPLFKDEENNGCRTNTLAWWVRDDAECGNGGIIAHRAGRDRSPYLPADLKGRAGSWCTHNDGVCARGTWTGTATTHLTHYQENGGAIDQAGLEAAQVYHLTRPDLGPLKGLKESVNGADVMIVFDTTGSMADEIDSARQAASQISSQVLAANGEIGLVQFRDFPDEDSDFVAKLETPLTTDAAAFQAALDRLSAGGGGDTPEATYSGIMTAYDQAGWHLGATKIIVVITDAPSKDPEPNSGYTLADITRRSLEIDPVAISSIDPCGCDSQTTDSLAKLASATGGAALTSGSDISGTFTKVLERASTRPVIRFAPTHRASVGQTIAFSAEGTFDPDSTIAGFRWDLNGDGSYETSTATPVASTTYGAPGKVTVGVAAVSTDGDVSTAISITTITKKAVVTRPNAVRRLHLKRLSARVISLNWAPPRGGAKVIRYLVQVKGRTVASVSAKAYRVILRGVPKARQRLSVVAISAADQGPKRTASG